MQTVLSAEEMSACDRKAIASYGIPGILLMESAGAGIARWIADRYGPLAGKSVCILSGTGNNGGDGFVIARHLAGAGAKVRVYAWSAPRSKDAAAQFRILQRMSRTMPAVVELKVGPPRGLSSLQPDLVVDAIFGTGFKGPVRKPFRQAIAWINEQKAPRIAVDIPSGVNGSTGEADEHSVSATVTLTLAALKRGLLCNEGRDRCGEIHVIDIGMPRSVFDGIPGASYVQSSDVSAILPRRPSTVHKYSAGKVFILAGSTGLTGAAALTARSALRAGAGAVVLGTPKAVYSILARTLAEVIVEPLPSTPDGTLALNGETAIRERMKWADVTVVGPGLSRHQETAELVTRLVREAKGNLLLDADALSIMASAGSSLRKSPSSRILTPHTGEASRLFGIPAQEIDRNRVDVARDTARDFRSLVVLKGAPTVVGDADGTVTINSTGNPGMATVGSGDVLSGIIAGLWAQGMGRRDAAVAGVYLHGRSGDLAASALGQRSLLASDLIDHLSTAFLGLEAA